MTVDPVTIEGVQSSPETLEVQFSDGETVSLPWLWVRDHSQDDSSFDRATGQRTVDTFDLAPNHPAGSARVGDDAVHITWPEDTPESVLPFDVLRTVAGKTDPAPRSLWRSPSDMSITALPYDEVDTTEAGLARWLDHIATYGMGLVSGAPTDISAVDTLVGKIGYVRHTVFGGTWTLSSEVTEHADSAYGAETLEPHTDGSYSHDGPGMQLFACVERTGSGGESVLVDGFAAAAALSDADPNAFDLLCSVSVPGHYVEDGVHLHASRPTIRLDDHGELLQVTFNNYDRAPFTLEPELMSKWYRAYSAFHALISNRSAWWTHRLEPGEVLIFDNWRCLHGRMAYTGTRVFNGAYLNHEDLESALRLSRQSSR